MWGLFVIFGLFLSNEIHVKCVMKAVLPCCLNQNETHVSRSIKRVQQFSNWNDNYSSVAGPHSMSSSSSSPSSSELSLPWICMRLNWMASWWCASLSGGSAEGQRSEVSIWEPKMERRTERSHDELRGFPFCRFCLRVCRTSLQQEADQDTTRVITTGRRKHHTFIPPSHSWKRWDIYGNVKPLCSINHLWNR